MYPADPLNLLVTILLMGSSPDNAPNADSIFWCQNNHLTWKDFRLDKNEPSASTTTIIVHNKVETPSGIVIKVKAVFLRRISAYNPEDTTNYLLKHEALHFDIAELVARRARKYFSGRTFDPNNLEPANARLREMNRDLRMINEVYDNRSSHSLNREGQQAWNKYVESELKALERYSVDCKQSRH